MKVKELIEELQKANPESNVVIDSEKHGEEKANGVKVKNSSSVLADVIIYSE